MALAGEELRMREIGVRVGAVPAENLIHTVWTGRSGSLGGMVSFLGLLLYVLASPFKSQARLEAEIVFLRHQLNLLQRRVRTKPRLTPWTDCFLSGSIGLCRRC